MDILVVNAGSSSIKYQVFDIKNNQPLIKGIIEKIGKSGACLRQESIGKEPVIRKEDIPDCDIAIQFMKESLLPPYSGLTDIEQIAAVGHRVVHGGEIFSASTLIDDEAIRAIEAYSSLAPLHNPANLAGIRACLAFFFDIPHVAVFDTAFHATMKELAYLYPIPYNLYQQHKIRRYGFHGTSHRYVSQRAATILEKPVETLRLITCHLGNGGSITAIQNGESVDTSMGFTPLEGIMMGTRSGDIDPSIVFYLMEEKNMSKEEVRELLNRDSGLLGISGIANDIRDLKQAIDYGHRRAKVALDMYIYRIQKYIGAFVSAMGGVDAIIFTAGVGENNPDVREAICKKLGYLGTAINKELNTSFQKEKIISTDGSIVKLMVIPTNEELLIAQDTYTIYKTVCQI